MEFSVKHGNLETLKTGCLVVAVNEGKALVGPAADLDKACAGQISAAIKQGDISGKAGQTLMLFGLPGITAQRVLLIGAGKDDERGDRGFRKLVHKAISTLKSGGATGLEARGDGCCGFSSALCGVGPACRGSS